MCARGPLNFTYNTTGNRGGRGCAGAAEIASVVIHNQIFLAMVALGLLDKTHQLRNIWSKTLEARTFIISIFQHGSWTRKRFGFGQPNPGKIFATQTNDTRLRRLRQLAAIGTNSIRPTTGTDSNALRQWHGLSCCPVVVVRTWYRIKLITDRIRLVVSVAAATGKSFGEIGLCI